jgi:FlaA1/EpsC-like NDP-sugar epimerase
MRRRRSASNRAGKTSDNTSVLERLKQLFPRARGLAFASRGFASRGLAFAPNRAPINILDLLGRSAVDLDTPELQRFIAGKRVLVTGAGGSIGSEICRQTARFCPQQLVLLDRAENALFEIDRELRGRWLGADIVPAVADICDARRIDQLFATYKPQVIFHCAAHKHVPMMESNPGEAIKNNVFGTKIVADAALAHHAAAFVMVSTDKAVNPTSVMGATKRIAELYIQSLNSGQWAVGSGQLRKRILHCRLPTADCRLSYFLGNSIQRSPFKWVAAI